MDTGQILKSITTARRILVVDHGFLGDTVHLAPALWELRRACPAAELHVLTTPVGAETLQLFPCADRGWALDTHSLRPQLQVLHALRRLRFDLAFNISGGDRSVFLTALSGARLKIAHESARRQFWRRWLIGRWVPRQDPCLPAHEQKRHMLRACGVELGDPVWNMRVPTEASQRAESLVPEGSVHFSINAGSPLKEWPVGRWIELARALLSSELGLRIVVTASGSAKEQERWRAFINGVNNERLIGVPPLKIPELAAVLQRCRVHVGGDSGVLHLAIALGLRTVSLFRLYHDVSAWMPTGDAHRVVMVPCSCVNQPDGPCHPLGPAQCLERIPAAEVAALVGQQLSAASKRTTSSRARLGSAGCADEA